MFKKVRKKTVVKRSKEDLIFDLLNYIVLGAFLLIVLYPLYFIIIASFSDPSRVLSGDVILLPKDLDFSGYQRFFPILASGRDTITPLYIPFWAPC